MFKLSICMMVKNEEKNIKRCLASLDKLLSNVNSELIIVDTGSTDHTVEIAKKYTSKIYHHAWNNNFSEMRNITIDYAQSEWIFIIDADEELVDADPIIEFINSSHNDDVAGAAIFLKNVKDYEAKVFGAELITPRIFKKTSGIKYEGTVHNLPVVKGKLLEVNATLYHYGYIQSDAELMNQKFIRTKALLEKALERDPNNIYYIFQLSVTYDMHKDYEKAYELVKETYDKINQLDYSLKDYIYIYSSYAKVAQTLGHYSEVIKICNEGLVLNDEYLDLHFFLAGTHLRIEEYDLGLRHYKEYLRLVNSYESLKIRQNPSIQLYTLNMKEEAYCNSCLIANKLEQYDYALTCASEVVKLGVEQSEYYQAIFEIYLKLLIRKNDLHEIIKWYSSLDHEGYKIKIVSSLVLEFIENEDCDMLNHILLDLKIDLEEVSAYNNICLKEKSHALEYQLLKGYFFYLNIKKANYEDYKEIEKNLALEIRGLVIDSFFSDHLPQQSYELFYQDLMSEEGMRGLYFTLLHNAENIEFLMNYTISDKVVDSLLTFELDYYKTMVALILHNSCFLSYLTKNVSDNLLNNMLITLSSNTSYLKDRLLKVIDLLDEAAIKNLHWERVIRYYFKTLLSIENDRLNWTLLECYHQYLLSHLSNKYQKQYIDQEMIDNFSNNEEAYGIALIRAGYYDRIIEPKWLLTASELMPITAKYLSIKLNECDLEIMTEDRTLELHLETEIIKLYHSGDIDSAIAILNEGLKLRPKSRILLDLKTTLQNQMN